MTREYTPLAHHKLAGGTRVATPPAPSRRSQSFAEIEASLAR